MHGAGAGADASAAAASSSSPDASDPSAASSGISADPTMMSASKRAMFEEGGAGIEGWKEMYYREKLGLKIGEAPPLAELRQAYFEGLNWVLRYYYRGVASWTWYYPFHYAPMASDLAKGLGDLTVAFDYGRPFRPFEQLLAVQPPQSAALLPEPFRWLMTAPHSPLAPFFPSELKVDFEGKRNDWEGVVLLPFLDEALLKQCIASVPRDKLSAAQIQRNEPGPLVVFQHAPAGAGDAPSTLPKVFPGLFPCKSKAFESMPPGEFPTNRACFGGRGCLLPGVKLGVDRPPGFPTMTSLEARGELKHAGVNVFGTASKKESLILRVGRGGDPGLLTDSDSADDSTRAAAFAHLLGRRVFISWPYLKESVVVAVSDKSEKIVGKGAGRQSHSSAEWGAEAQRAANALMQTKGVDVGQTAVQLHCRQCEGLVRHPDGSLQKRFGKTDVLVPAHLALASDPSPSPRLKERGPTMNATSGASDPADPNADASSNDSGGFRAGDAALYLGRSHFGAIATVAGFVPGRGLECFVQPAAPDTGVGRRVLQASSAAGRFEPAGAVARKLGLHPRALSALTGPLWIAPTKDCGRFDRVDVGLNLKSAAKGLCVSGFTRPGKDGAGWDYGQGAIQLMQEYKRAHGWVFAALQSDPDGGFEGLELDVALKHVPEAARLPALKALKAWLKAAPSAKKPLVSKFSKIAPDAAIKALHAAVGGQSVRDARDAKLEPVALEGVSPLLLMRPVTQGEVMDLYAGGDFELGDRVAMVGDGGSPPFGTRGFVVATHGEAAEVMFDARDFVGATDLHGALPEKRGAMLPVAQLVNLSHPPAMPQLGDAAPATRARDKKGKVTKGGWDGKDGKGAARASSRWRRRFCPGARPPSAGRARGGCCRGPRRRGRRCPTAGEGSPARGEEGARRRTERGCRPDARETPPGRHRRERRLEQQTRRRRRRRRARPRVHARRRPAQVHPRRRTGRGGEGRVPVPGRRRDPRERRGAFARGPRAPVRRFHLGGAESEAARRRERPGDAADQGPRPARTPAGRGRPRRVLDRPRGRRRAETDERRSTDAGEGDDASPRENRGARCADVARGPRGEDQARGGRGGSCGGRGASRSRTSRRGYARRSRRPRGATTRSRFGRSFRRGINPSSTPSWDSRPTETAPAPAPAPARRRSRGAEAGRTGSERDARFLGFFEAFRASTDERVSNDCIRATLANLLFSNPRVSSRRHCRPRSPRSSSPAPRSHASSLASRLARPCAPQSSSPFRAPIASSSSFSLRRAARVFFFFLPRFPSVVALSAALRLCISAFARSSPASARSFNAALRALSFFSASSTIAACLAILSAPSSHPFRAHGTIPSPSHAGQGGAALRAGDGAARIVGVAGPLEVFALLPPGAPPRAVLELARGDPERDVAVARRGEAHGGLGLSTSSRIAARGRRLDRLEVPPPERALVRGPVGAHDRARVHVVLRVEPAGVQRARAAARPARRRARAAAPRAHAAAGRGRRAERVHEGRRRRRGPAGVRSRARRGGTGTRGVRRRRERDDATTRAGGLESAGRTRGARARADERARGASADADAHAIGRARV